MALFIKEKDVLITEKEEEIQLLKAQLASLQAATITATALQDATQHAQATEAAAQAMRATASPSLSLPAATGGGEDTATAAPTPPPPGGGPPTRSRPSTSPPCRYVPDPIKIKPLPRLDKASDFHVFVEKRRQEAKLLGLRGIFDSADSQLRPSELHLRGRVLAAALEHRNFQLVQALLEHINLKLFDKATVEELRDLHEPHRLFDIIRGHLHVDTAYEVEKIVTKFHNTNMSASQHPRDYQRSLLDMQKRVRDLDADDRQLTDAAVERKLLLALQSHGETEYNAARFHSSLSGTPHTTHDLYKLWVEAYDRTLRGKEKLLVGATSLRPAKGRCNYCGKRGSHTAKDCRSRISDAAAKTTAGGGRGTEADGGTAKTTAGGGRGKGQPGGGRGRGRGKKKGKGRGGGRGGRGDGAGGNGGGETTTAVLHSSLMTTAYGPQPRRVLADSASGLHITNDVGLVAHPQALPPGKYVIQGANGCGAATHVGQVVLPSPSRPEGFLLDTVFVSAAFPAALAISEGLLTDQHLVFDGDTTQRNFYTDVAARARQQPLLHFAREARSDKTATTPGSGHCRMGRRPSRSATTRGSRWWTPPSDMARRRRSQRTRWRWRQSVQPSCTPHSAGRAPSPPSSTSSPRTRTR
jgi:hypothetical protein